uniref:Uncharacterized protein n=1 Tax=Skeletonema marinoi TaxID=267567 RepID=A0A7S2P333_9STRA
MPSPTANGADVGTLTNPSGQHGLLALQQTDQQTNLDDFNLQTRHLSKDLTLGEMVRRPHVTFHFNLTPKAQGNPISLARIKQNIDEMLSSNLPGLPTDILDCAQLTTTIAFNIFTELIATPTAVSQAFTLTTPPQEPSALDLSTLHPPSPTENATIPSRCPCKSCELSILPTFTTAADYIKHINTFHSDFFQLLNDNRRLSYSIAMCVGCNLLLPPDELTNHLQTCQHHRLSQASATSTSASTTGQPSTPPTTPADESTITILAGFCPEARKADFEALLPHASNEELTQAVQGWVSASTNNSHP